MTYQSYQCCLWLLSGRCIVFSMDGYAVCNEILIMGADVSASASCHSKAAVWLYLLPEERVERKHEVIFPSSQFMSVFLITNFRHRGEEDVDHKSQCSCFQVKIVSQVQTVEVFDWKCAAVWSSGKCWAAVVCTAGPEGWLMFSLRDLQLEAFTTDLSSHVAVNVLQTVSTTKPVFVLWTIRLQPICNQQHFLPMWPFS